MEKENQYNKEKNENTDKFNTVNSQHKIIQQSANPANIQQNQPNLQSQLYQCKICLVEVNCQKKDKQKIISPCKCTGSMKYVHQVCVVSWLNSIVKRNLQIGQNTYYIGCQICKNSYKYETTYKYQCLSYQQVKYQIKLNLGIFLLGIFFILAALAGIVLLGVFGSLKILKIEKNGSILQILLILSIILFTTIVAAWILRLIHTLLVRKIFYVKTVFQTTE